MRDLEIVLCHLHSRFQPRYPRFKLCPECRAEAPREAIVVEAVVNYFSKPEFEELFIQTEHEIQMGTDSRRPDIVLLDAEGNFVAIAECKQAGVVDYGYKQLQSYLCATDTQFGVFANSKNPNDWEFYENLRWNRFKKIECLQFEREVLSRRPIEPIREEKRRLTNEIGQLKRNNGKLIDENRREIEKHARLEQQISLLEARKPELETEVRGLEEKKREIQSTRERTKRSWQYIAGVLGVALCVSVIVLIIQLNKKNTQSQDSSQIVSQLKNENETLVGENQTLQRQLTNKNKQIERDTNTISQLKDDNKALVSRNQALTKRLTDKDKQIGYLNSEVLRLKKELQACLGQPPNPLSDPELPPGKSVTVNINTASIEELQKLPNIGPKKAQDIIDYRQKHGNFNSVDDITKVKGIGKTTLKNLRPLIRVK